MAEDKSGTIKETMARSFSMSFPCSKSTPLDDWAFIILSVSSKKVGIKRSAKVIVIATSEVGKWNTFKGVKYHSKAKVKSKGFVVAVKIVVKETIKTKRIII